MCTSPQRSTRNEKNSNFINVLFFRYFCREKLKIIYI